MDQPPEQKHPERPLECTECKRAITYYYTEVIGTDLIQRGMCSVCPELERRLHASELLNLSQSAKAGLSCGECGTTLDAVRMGHPLGCSVCYSVFGDVLLQDLLISKTINPAVAKKKKSVPLHIGRTPGETQEISPSLQLIALNEALTETLQREDYEQAAWLRDQIKAITEENDNNTKK